MRRLLSRLDMSMPRMAPQAPPPEEPGFPLYGESYPVKPLVAAQPVVSPWVRNAQAGDRPLVGGLPANTTAPVRRSK